jgi:hypothetical protein
VAHPVVLVDGWAASTKPGKDAGSAHIVNTGATEDAAWRSVIAVQTPPDAIG